MRKVLADPARHPCPSRKLMQPWGDNSGGVLERQEIRQPGLVRLTGLDDRPVYLGLRTGVFATGDNNPDTRTEVA